MFFDIRNNCKNYNLCRFIEEFEFKTAFDMDFDTDSNNSNVIEQALLNCNIDCFSEGFINICGIYDYEKNTFEFIDKQSYLTFKKLFDFIELNNFKLTNMQFLTDLEGLDFNSLPMRYRRRLKELPLRICFFDNLSVSNEDKDKLISMYNGSCF